MSSIENYLSEQVQELELEKMRLNEEAGGDFVVGAQSARSSISITSDKLKKDALNQAMTGAEPDTAHSTSSGRRLLQNMQQKNEVDARYSNDSFYSHFPSYGNENKQREQLVSNRHQEYRDHLSKIAEKEANETQRKREAKQTYDDDHKDDSQTNDNPISGPYSNHHQTQDESVKHVAGSQPDHKDALDGLKHSSTMDDSMATAGIIKDSNEEYAQEATRRKMEYQRDLMKQIEEKKQEVKALRAREKAEDEQMTKRLEEQLKSIQLEEQLRKERKRSEQVRISSEQNHIYRMHLLSQLDRDPRPSVRPAERTAPPKVPPWSQNEMAIALPIADDDDENDAVFDSFDPRKAYKYFSNSARPLPPSVHRVEKHTPPQKPFQAFLEVKRPSPSDTHSPTTLSPDYCKRCHDHMRTTAMPPNIVTTTVCNYCERRRHNMPINEDFCLKCSVLLATLTERQNGMCAHCRQTDLRCGFCRKHIDVCPTCGAVFCLRCHRRQLRQVDEETAVMLSPSAENEENVRPLKHQPQHAHRKSPSLWSNRYDEDRPIIAPHLRKVAAPLANAGSDSEHDLPSTSAFVVRRDDEPFSTNVPRTSIFHPQARTDAPKVAVSIRHGQVYVDEQASKYATSYDSYPVPLMPTTKGKDVVAARKSPPLRQAAAKRETQPSLAVRKLQQKWEIPAVQKNVMSTRPSVARSNQPQRVLTQLGAIRRQLQLEQMEMDETNS